MLMFPVVRVGGGGKATGGGSGTSQPLADYVAPSPVWSQSLQLQAESYYSNAKGSLSVKARVLIILSFLLVCAMAFGQGPDSFVYVKQFPGKDVGTKVANAMQTCNPNTAITCYLAIDPSLAIYAPGTMPTLCSHCVLYDWRGGIPGGVSNISLFIQSLDPTHLPVTQNGNVTDLNLANVDKLDQTNTHNRRPNGPNWIPWQRGPHCARHWNVCRKLHQHELCGYMVLDWKCLCRAVRAVGGGKQKRRTSDSHICAWKHADSNQHSKPNRPLLFADHSRGR